jgi:hypothetical protein
VKQRYQFTASITYEALNLDDALQQIIDHLTCVKLMVPEGSPLEMVGSISLDHCEENEDA